METPTAYHERDINYVVDSASRDKTLYASPASYELTLDSTINNVVSMELVNIYMPFTMPLVSSSAGNKFTFNDSVVVVPEGNYVNKDVSALVSVMDGLVRSVDSGSVFAFDNITEKFRFTRSSPNAFTVDFTYSGVLADILGFGRARYESVYDNVREHHVIVAPHRKNLNAHAFQNTIVMRLNDYARVASNNQAVDTCFCVLVRHDDVEDMRCKHVLLTPKHMFHPPLKKLAKLKVTFTDLAGVPYDFDGQEHHFEILVRFREPVLRPCT